MNILKVLWFYTLLSVHCILSVFQWREVWVEAHVARGHPAAVMPLVGKEVLSLNCLSSFVKNQGPRVCGSGAGPPLCCTGLRVYPLTNYYTDSIPAASPLRLEIRLCAHPFSFFSITFSFQLCTCRYF